MNKKAQLANFPVIGFTLVFWVIIILIFSIIFALTKPSIIGTVVTDLSYLETQHMLNTYLRTPVSGGMTMADLLIQSINTDNYDLLDRESQTFFAEEDKWVIDVYQKQSKDSPEGPGTNLCILANPDYYDITDVDSWIDVFTGAISFYSDLFTTGEITRPDYRYDKLSAASVLLPNVQGAPISMIKVYLYREHEEE